ncbi:ChaN family lipoprotein [Ramlibacter sp. Leaf400]|uniref:ChaN family lipoprotein n=1 Tax=Ramlibacter sp. Leaf400 TaxID=1736365 RepID=UPI0006FAE4A6|nr:ChaN family lipoprotein [Ramlibacter sp. Leaf400]KQT12430.1 hypothetical protein ASG30_03820 [Ramlibacter sp. Leaf400]
MRTALCTWGLAALATLAGCASPGPGVDELAGADIVLLGEQHDDAAHQRQHRDTVQSLAARGRLAAVALEMAEQGRSTAGLPRNADEGDVRAALHWNEEAWPWSAYGPAVMAAVAAGVPVLGANLPRDRMRQAMADASLDDTLDAAALAGQREAIRTGHCDLLPQQQLAPMARVQIARDRAMAQTLERAAVPGRAVLLLAGAGHVLPELGVPRHLPPALVVRPVVLPASGSKGAAAPDYCAQLRERMQRR